MEGEEEVWTSVDDSEEERELEIALYSQIHFEPGPEQAGGENYHFMDNGNVSFNVGVKEILLPLQRNSMKAASSESDGHYFSSHSKQQTHFRNHVDHTDAIYVTTSSDDDDSIEVVSSDTIREESVCDRNQTDDECILLEMSTSENNKRSCFVEDCNRATSLGNKLPSSSNTNGSDISSSFSTSKAQDVIIPISNSPKQTNCEQISGEVVSVVSDQNQRESFNNDDDDVMILDAYIQLEESLHLTEPNETRLSVPEKSVSQISLNEKEKDSVLDEKNVSPDVCSERPGSYTNTAGTEKPKEHCNILPFAITKTSCRIDKETSLGELDTSEKEPPPTKVHEKTKIVGKKRPFKIAPEKQEFLKFSETLSKVDKDVIRLKKRKLSKQEAAVKLRKPPVLLRKPPAVKVSYQQDSDTNTDYSDSDTCTSSATTPKKVLMNRKAMPSRKNVREKGRDIVENDATSSSSSLEIENECPRSVSTSEKTCNSNIKLKNEKQHLKDRKQTSSGMETKERGSEESDTASSVSSHTTDLEEVTRHNPALDFNIEGGVKSLLKRQPEKTDDDAEKWQISDQDRYKIPVTMSRYFSPFAFTCRNCNKEGHKALECPEPKKSICIFCGKMGHVYQSCPESICWNCNEPGHRLNDCKERPRSRHAMCDRCWMPGHLTEDCPDSWRQYHLTLGPGDTKIQTASKKHRNPKVYCFNCGKEGHLGYECNSPMMNIHVVPNYPFIAKYNTGGPKENRNTRRKKEREEREKKKKNKRYEQDFETSKKHVKKGHEIEYWEHSERKDVGRTPHKSKRKGHFLKEEDENHHQSGRGKTRQKTHKNNAGKKENNEESKNNRSKDQIVTETTVFKFQNSTSQDCHKEYYGPPMKIRITHGNKNKNNNKTNNNLLYPHRIVEQLHVEDLYSRPNHHHDDAISGDEEFLNHQVFNNEWWNEENDTEHKKKGKKKSSRKNTTSKSMKTTEGSHFGNHEIYFEHHTHQYAKRGKQREVYETSRKHISSHQNQQSASNSTREVYVTSEHHKFHYESGYRKHNKKKNKAGFQMNSLFQSLSRSCRKK